MIPCVMATVGGISHTATLRCKGLNRAHVIYRLNNRYFRRTDAHAPGPEKYHQETTVCVNGGPVREGRVLLTSSEH